MTPTFLSLYAPWGAYAPFVLGAPGEGGGFALSDVHSPRQNLYVAYQQGQNPVQILPFLSRPINVPTGAAAFGAQDATPQVPFEMLRAEDVDRTYRWATDTFTAGPLLWRIYTPFGTVMDWAQMSEHQKKIASCPVILIDLDFDNQASDTPATVFFGLDGINRPLSDTTAGGLLGVAHGRTWGIAALPARGVEEVQDWDVLAASFGGRTPRVRRIDQSGGVMFTVPAGSRGQLTLALGTYQQGQVTTGITTRYAYTEHFRDLEEVLLFGLHHRDLKKQQALRLDRELQESGLSEERQFLISHATRGYLASTQLLLDRENRPLWVVNEGEYRMMNTLDLTIDQIFWELRFHPWTVKNVLELYLSHYSFADGVQAGDQVQPGGISFAHDMGVSNAFAPSGRSAYETEKLHGLFSHMTCEQLANWSLCAVLYGQQDPEWIRSQTGILQACVQSFLARDGDGDGIMDRDSARCQGGSEITTYDALDESLGQARGNLYLAVKCWAALVCLAHTLDMAGLDDSLAEQQADRAAHSIAAKLQGGFIPALLTEPSQSCIIPAIEGLVYPLTLGLTGLLSEAGRYGNLIRALKVHLQTALTPGVCLDPVSGGWKLSSTSDNTWMSKIFLNQFVAETVFGLSEQPEVEQTHVNWQQNGCRHTGPTDQVRSSDGTDLGSRLYPRLVSSVLWLDPLKSSVQQNLQLETTPTV